MQKMSTKPNLTCDICEKTFLKSFNMLRHKKNVHNIKIPMDDPNRIKKKKYCPSENCQFVCKTLSEVRDHLKTEHGVDIKHSLLQFNNKEEFHAWKTKEEKDTISSFIKHRAPKKLVHSTRQYCRCSRSGFMRESHSNITVKTNGSAKTLKGHGSSKISAVCPAEMMVDTFPNSDRIVVNYYPTHHGHDHESVYLRLTPEERTEIAEKLRQGAGIDGVLDEFRDIADINPDDRLFLLCRKDLHNIILSCDVDLNSQPPKNDVSSLETWIKNIQNSNQDDTILFYKKQGNIDYNSILGENDFMLVLMTSNQKEILLKYAAEAICVDSTYGTNTYDFQLSTVMVINNYNEAYPVAFCISNRVDEPAMKVFFNTIEDSVGIVRTKIFMSFDAISLKSWKRNVQLAERNLLSTWQVDRSWRNKMIIRMKKKQKIPHAYKMLRKLHIEETNPDEFEKKLSEFLNALENDEDSARFHKYFVEYYAGNFKSWAHCYRSRSTINMDLRFSSLHRNLKRIYFGDNCVDQLMKFLKTKEVEISSESSKIRLTSAREEINENHARGALIPPERINSVIFNRWKISSKDCLDTYHIVEKIQETCSFKNCVLQCHECNICIHQYHCDCSDYAMKNTICEHIHSIINYDEKYGYDVDVVYMEVIEEDSSSITDTEDTVDFHVEDEVEKFSNQNAKMKLDHIYRLLLDPDIDEECQQAVFKQLDQVVQILENKKK